MEQMIGRRATDNKGFRGIDSILAMLFFALVLAMVIGTVTAITKNAFLMACVFSSVSGLCFLGFWFLSYVHINKKSNYTACRITKRYVSMFLHKAFHHWWKPGVGTANRLFVTSLVVVIIVMVAGSPVFMSGLIFTFIKTLMF